MGARGAAGCHVGSRHGVTGSGRGVRVARDLGRSLVSASTNRAAGNRAAGSDVGVGSSVDAGRGITAGGVKNTSSQGSVRAVVSKS